MFDHHPFGLACGAGGVDHVRQVARVQRGYARVADRLGFPARLIEVDQLHRGAVYDLTGSAVHQHGQRRTVAQHVADTFSRVSWVNWHIGAACLEDGQQPDHHRQPALDADRYTVIRFDAQADQMMGKPIGLLIELAIAQLAFLGDQCNGSGRAPYLGLEQPVQRLRHVVRRLRGIGQQSPALIRRQYR